MNSRRKDRLMTVIAVLAALLVPSMTSAQSVEHIKIMMRGMNNRIEAMEANYRIGAVEYLTNTDELGQTIFFDDRMKQMGFHWVPGDPRRGGFFDISWLSDQIDGVATGLTLSQTQTALKNAMATWDHIQCSDIPLIQLDDSGSDWGLTQFMLSSEGSGNTLIGADIMHAGWLPGAFFDTALGAGASTSVLGATFTWIFDSGTDIDNNGKIDVAFREIYYNNNFIWGNNNNFSIDVETVVLHESGHGLSQGHFGKLFMTNKNGKLHFAPLAVMNNHYSGVQQTITGSDMGGHCSIWGSWPNN